MQPDYFPPKGALGYETGLWPLPKHFVPTVYSGILMAAGVTWVKMARTSAGR